MSIEAVRAFMGKVKADPDLQEKLEAIERLLGPKSAAPSARVSCNAVLQEMFRSLAAEAVSSGRFFVTTADVQQALKALNDPEIDRLFA